MSVNWSISPSAVRHALVSGLVLAICGAILGAAPAPAVPLAPFTPAVSSAPEDGANGVDVVELDLQGIDPDSKQELEAVSETAPAPAAPADPDESPGLTTVDPLGVLPDAAAPEVLTERLTDRKSVV